MSDVIHVDFGKTNASLAATESADIGSGLTAYLDSLSEQGEFCKKARKNWNPRHRQ
jgi:hypothetical protein